MILQVRQGVFETNSSSTHTLTICTKEDYEDWEHGDKFWLDNDWGKLQTSKSFVTSEELEELTEKYNEEEQKRKGLPDPGESHFPAAYLANGGVRHS